MILCRFAPRLRREPQNMAHYIITTAIHRCKVCGALSSNRIAADDNPMKLMSLAMKPVSSPPFPLERIEEITKLVDGDGELKR